MQYMINGARYDFSTVLGASVLATAISNANPAEVLTATPPINGSIVFLQSGWNEINGGVFRTSLADLDSFALTGLDATDVARYPAGAGAGSFRVASAFVALSQIRMVEQAGGEQNYFTFQYVEDPTGTQQESPTFKSARRLNMQLDYDPTLPWHAALKKAERDRVPVVIRETLVNGDTNLYVGRLSFNDVPTKGMNENMTVMLNLAVIGEPRRFAAV